MLIELKRCLIIVALALSIQNVTSSNILLLTPIGSKSHKIYYMGIVNALLDRGHQVTIVSGYANSKPTKGLTDIVLDGAVTATALLKNVFEEGGADTLIKDLIFQSPELCASALADPKVQNLKKEKFDVVILSLFFDYCFLSLVDHMKVPLIFTFSGGLFGPFMDITGQIEIPSLVPNKLLGASFPQTFKERFLTVVLNFMLGTLFHHYLDPKMLSVCKERGLCRPDMPPFAEFYKNVSITIINEYRSLEQPPRPLMQNIIYAGGAHIKPGKPLPKDLEKWVKESGEAGFIFFSLGSAVNPSDMKENHRKIILKTFAGLKQRVLWKWNEGSMANLPPNVRVEKWLPQSDILAHPKLKLFISHGGLSSIMESSYHGASILGIPIFADQFSNINIAVSEGWGKVINWKDLSEEKFSKVINEIISDESMRKISKSRSKLIKDVPINSADEAAFWVEYVIRHKGAPHLRSPIHQLTWIELNNADVWFLLSSIIATVLIVIYKTVKWLIFWCCFKKETKKFNKKNKRD